MLVTSDGGQLKSAELASAYKRIYGVGHLSCMSSAYPQIFPPYIPSVGIASLNVESYGAASETTTTTTTTTATTTTTTTTTNARPMTASGVEIVEPVQGVRARMSAPSPNKMDRYVPSAPPSPPDPSSDPEASASTAAPAAAPAAAPTKEKSDEVHEVNAVGPNLTPDPNPNSNPNPNPN